MKIYLHNSVYFILLIITILPAQNLTKQEMLEFYPHHIGDIWSYLWVYYDESNNFYEAGSSQFMVYNDTLVDNEKYWLLNYECSGCGSPQKYLERIDTLSGNVLRVEDLYSGEINCVDNVYANIGDTVSISNNRDLIYCDKLVVLSFRDTVINSIPTTIRRVIGLPEQRLLYFAKNIGMLGSGENFWIDSAYVSGFSYSNITDIKNEDKPINDKFILSQNYPNPFNPVTTIDYSLTKSDFVTIKIYDYLGREIKTLISENKSRGNYSMQFNGSNFASGIYFYKLQIGKEFTDIKKMILLK